MFKRYFSMFKRLFFWPKYRSRSLIEYRATNLAVQLTLSGQLTPYRLIHSRSRR